MDCRRPLVLALSLVGGAAGCAHQVAAVPVAAQPPSKYITVASAPPAAAPEPAREEAAAPPKPHRPETLVAYGDFATREADAAGQKPAQQEQIRDRARRAYQEALKVDPGHLPAYKGLAHLYLAMGDFEHAAATYQAALRLAPADATLWSELGMCHARAKAWPAAVEELSKAVEIDPENRTYGNFLGYALARCGRYDDSLAVFARHHGEAKAHYSLALMLDHLQQPEPCKVHLRAALDKDPRLEDARQMLARLEGAATAPAVPTTPTVPPVQTVSYSEPRPSAPAPGAAPATEAPAARPETKRPVRRVILPPPPEVQIHYQQPVSAPETPKAGPDGQK